VEIPFTQIEHSHQIINVDFCAKQMVFQGNNFLDKHSNTYGQSQFGWMNRILFDCLLKGLFESQSTFLN